jgi:N-terminal acetyltransferase B complex non-catalytic subunit
MTITDRLFNLLHACTSKSPSFTTLPPIPTLDKEPPEAAEMTAAEISNWKMHIKLTKLLYHLMEESTTAECLAASTAAVEEWLRETVAYQGDKATLPLHASAYSKNILIPNWSFLHWSFITLDTLKAVTLLLDLDSKGAKSKAKKSPKCRIPREKTTEIRALVTQIFDTIRDGAKRLKDALSSGILEEFLDLMLERPEDLSLEQGGLGTKLEMVLAHVGGESFLENFCGQMRNAWDEALDGVLMVKL